MQIDTPHNNEKLNRPFCRATVEVQPNFSNIKPSLFAQSRRAKTNHISLYIVNYCHLNNVFIMNKANVYYGIKYDHVRHGIVFSSFWIYMISPWRKYMIMLWKIIQRMTLVYSRLRVLVYYVIPSVRKPMKNEYIWIVFTRWVCPRSWQCII